MKHAMLGFYDVGQKVMYEMTVTQESRELTYINRKGRNTACVHDNNWTIPAKHEPIVSIPTMMEFKTKVSRNDDNDATKVPLSPVLTQPDGINTVPNELSHTQSEATERQIWNWAQTQNTRRAFLHAGL